MIEEPTKPTTPQLDSIMQRLSYLQEALLAQDPRIRDHLKEIHKLMITHEELVHLLSDEDIAKIMSAQQVVTNTTLVATTTGTKGKATATKKATGLSLGDL
jgi:hypothetical protein